MKLSVGFPFLQEQKYNNKFRNTNVSFLTKIFCLMVTCCNASRLMTNKIMLFGLLLFFVVLVAVAVVILLLLLFRNTINILQHSEFLTSFLDF